MRIRWTPSAADDLEAIADYASAHFPMLAKQTIRQIYQAVRELRTMPYRGRTGLEYGTRELVIAGLPYIAVYRLKDDAVEVLRIYHGAQLRES